MFKLGSLMITEGGDVFGVVEEIFFDSFTIRYWFKHSRLIHYKIKYHEDDLRSYEHWMTLKDYVSTFNKFRLVGT